MWKLLQPPAYKAEMTADQIDRKHHKLSQQLFIGILIG